MLLQLYSAAHCPLSPAFSSPPLPCPFCTPPPPHIALHVEPLQRVHHTPAAAGTPPVARSGACPIRCRRLSAVDDEWVFVGADGQSLHQLRRRAHHSQQGREHAVQQLCRTNSGGEKYRDLSVKQYSRNSMRYVYICMAVQTAIHANITQRDPLTHLPSPLASHIQTYH